jgi:hypothetical protein
MKYLIIILSYLPFLVNSQVGCINDVSTNPLNPSNDALPSGTSTYANQYLNGFNWFPVDTNGLYDDYTCTNISFAGTTYSEMNNILSNSLPYYNYLEEQPLPLGINGWELLLVNLGRFPDDVTPITAGNSNYSIPYIVIYNRYSGIIRIFVNYGLDKSVYDYADAMEIDLQFLVQNQLSGLLRLTEGMDRPLDVTTEVQRFTAIVKAPAQGQQWASTDIRIAYDPCTCFYPSKLYLSFKQIKHSEIELHGRSITLENESLIDNATLQVNPEDYLTGFDYTGETVSGNGMIMHKAMQTLIDDYIQKYAEYNDKLVAVGEHNKNVKRNLAILKAVKYIIGYTMAPPANIIPTNEAMTELAAEAAEAEANGMSTEAIEAAYEGLGAYDTDWFKVVENMQDAYVKIDAAGNKIMNTADLFKKATQIFGEKAKVFIAKNFVEQNPPVPPSQPSATFSEMHYVGQITQSVEIGGFDFYSPGSYGSQGTGTPTITSVYEYPVYNEVLGTFALLNSPKINISKYVSSDNEHILSQNTTALFSAVNAYSIETQRYRSWTKEYQFQLAEDLKYAINGAVDLKNIDIQASFEIVAKPKLSQQIPVYTILNGFNDPVRSVNVVSNNSDISTYKPITNSEYNYHENFNIPDYNSYYTKFSQGEPNIEFDIIKDSITLQTIYMPIDAFKPLVAGVGIKNELKSYSEQLIPITDVNQYDINYNQACSCYLADLTDANIQKPNDINQMNGGLEYEFDVELKLIVDMEFNTLNENGLTNKVTQLLTYKIDPANIIYSNYPIVVDLATTTDNIGQFKQNIHFSTTDFHGQQVDGCILNGTEYTCQAWKDIYITGNLTTSNGYKATLKAGNQITVENESIVSPETILMINPILDFSHPMPPADQTYVTNFCQGNLGVNSPSYHANVSGKNLNVQSNEFNQGIKSESNDWNFSLFPNPASKNTIVQIDNSAIVIGSIELYDLTGKKIEIFSNSLGNNTFNLDLKDCSKGMYFVKVSTLSGIQTKQLIIE